MLDRSRWLPLARPSPNFLLVDWTQHCHASHRLRRRTSVRRDGGIGRTCGVQPLRFVQNSLDHARSFRFRDQLWPNVQVGYRGGYLCTRIIALCGFRTKVSAFGDDFLPKSLTHSNDAELELQSGARIFCCKIRKTGAPGTIGTCGLCLRRANANQPCCPPPTEIEGLGQYLDEPWWISWKGWKRNASFRRSSNGGF